MEYPLSDSTSSDLKKVLFPPGVSVFAEDWETIESYRETESIQRFNSIVKTPGVVTKKATEANVDTSQRKLFPIGVSANQLSITSGVGFTGNGARIYLPTGLSITDVSSVTGYVDPSAFGEGTGLYLVLRKTIYQYATRTHPISGELKNTRQEILYNNSIVEFITSNDLSTMDRDVIVLGRLTNNGVTATPVFDVTELTGGRKVLRITEALTCETSGFIMEGDIDMNNQYQVKNLPQWASSYWTKEGSVHNNDFRKLFSRINHRFLIVGGVKFTYEGGVYGIKFTSGTYPIKIFPYQKPPNRISIPNERGSATVKSIPANQLMYIELTENEAGVGVTNLGDLVISLDTRGVLTSLDTFNNGISGNLLRFPIAYNDNNTRLLFPDGTVLLLEEEIDSAGKYSGYVRRDGGNIMTGQLEIEMTNPSVLLTGNNGLGGDISGLYIRNTITAPTRMAFYHVASTDIIYLDSYNSGGVLVGQVIFTGGNIQISGTPTNNADVVSLGYANSKYFPFTGGTISGNVLITGTFGVGTIDRLKDSTFYGDIYLRQSGDGTRGNLYVYGDVDVYGNSLLRGNLEVGTNALYKSLTLWGGMKIGFQTAPTWTVDDESVWLYSVDDASYLNKNLIVAYNNDEIVGTQHNEVLINKTYKSNWLSSGTAEYTLTTTPTDITELLIENIYNLTNYGLLTVELPITYTHTNSNNNGLLITVEQYIGSSWTTVKKWTEAIPFDSSGGTNPQHYSISKQHVLWGEGATKYRVKLSKVENVGTMKVLRLVDAYEVANINFVILN